MSKLVWHQVGKRLFETGVKKGVLYVQSDGLYPKGVVWNGLTAMKESPTGAEANPFYADDMKYLNLMSVEELEGTIEAYTYPDEFAECDGSVEIAPGVSVGQQIRKTFGLCYRTSIGNELEGADYGYKLHLVYGALASPSGKDYNTINDNPEAMPLSWDYTTTPVEVPGKKPTASIVIDSTKVDSLKLQALENILYGTENADARLPLPEEIAELFSEEAPSALELSSIVPDDEAEAIALDANIVLTFNNKIAKEAIVVTEDDGTIVTGTKSWDAAGKVLTFIPGSNLESETVYIVTIGGVVDVYGQTLAPEVTNFMTVT
ncbi:MAG: Ig-like domain-containing protein [Clostridiaceae bacterium]|nr:Ig-like domain-containing protein [Clostridiaceae bacterium]